MHTWGDDGVVLIKETVPGLVQTNHILLDYNRFSGLTGGEAE